MLQRTRYWISGAILLALIFIISVYAAGSTTKWENLGFSFKKAYNDVNKDNVIAKVDGEQITKQEFDGEKAFLSVMLGKEPSSQEVMDKIINDKVLLIEAKKLNLYPDRDETLVYMKELQSIKEKAKSEGAEIDKESENNWKETLKGLGMTEDEYWKSESTIKGYQASLAIAKLRSKLEQDWGFTPEIMATPKGIEEYEKRLNNMVQEREKDIKIETLEKNLIR